MSQIAPIEAQGRQDNRHQGRQPVSQSYAEQRKIGEFFALEEIRFGGLWLWFGGGKNTEKVGKTTERIYVQLINGDLCATFDLAPWLAKLCGQRLAQADW